MCHSCEVCHGRNPSVLWRMPGHLSHWFCFLKDDSKRPPVGLSKTVKLKGKMWNIDTILSGNCWPCFVEQRAGLAPGVSAAVTTLGPLVRWQFWEDTEVSLTTSQHRGGGKVRKIRGLLVGQGKLSQCRSTGRKENPHWKGKGFGCNFSSQEISGQ